MVSKFEQEDLKDEVIIGIDLGTTNSEVAVVIDGQPHIISEDGSGILPSVVGLDQHGALLVGEPAVNQSLVAPERTARSIKRKMGTDEKARLGDTEYSPQEISALILRRLKERAERHLGGDVRKAVITVPAYFKDAARQATREAGELAGLEVVRVLHEPTAASLVYEADRHQSGSQEPHRILVYDLGGGTFDVSIVEMSGGVVEVKASHGDTHLGGDDFDTLLLEHIARRFKDENKVDLLASPRTRARLLAAVERAKCELSSHPYARIDEEFVAERKGTSLHLSMEVNRNDYEDLIRLLVERSLSSVQTALHDAGHLARDMDELILVGGSTRTPLIQRELEERTGLRPRFEVDPDLCVALGAAIQAAMISGEDARSVLVDITPHTLGIRCLTTRFGGLDLNHFSPIIPKGTALPATRSEVYSTSFDDQKAVNIDVFQGEHGDVRENTRLGTFTVDGLSPQPAGNPIVVDFRMTLDGILEVNATEKATGLSNNVVIDHALHSLSEEERSAARDRVERLVGGGGGSEDRHTTSRDAEPGTEDRRQDVPEEAEVDLDADEEIKATVERIRRLLRTMGAQDREDAVQLIERAREKLRDGRTDEARAVHEEMKELIFYVEES